MGLPTLYILRHGETEWNVQKRMQGVLDSPLTETGIAQAEAQRDILGRVLSEQVHWLSSPMPRALRTAQIVMADRQAPLIKDDRLREIELGEWTGKTREEITAARPDLLGLSFYDAAPGGEGITALSERLKLFLAGIEGASVIVTHGITSRILRCLATDLDPSKFEDVGGGQGIIYRIKAGRQEMLQ